MQAVLHGRAMRIQLTSSEEETLCPQLFDAGVYAMGCFPALLWELGELMV